MNNGKRSGPRVAALVGPYQSGKTSLMEALLSAAGGLSRRGSVGDGTSVGDATPEARARRMSVDMNVASFSFLEEDWTLLDCPGSLELAAEAQRALMVSDVAIVVAEPTPDKAAALAPLLKQLDDNGMPHMVFINKMDQLAGAGLRVRDVMQALQGASQRPLVLRQIPIREGQEITGYVDLVSERAYRWRKGQASDLIPLPEAARDREQDARQHLLETLADYDDALMEQLLEDMPPSREDVYRQLSKDLHGDLIVPVFLGCADRDHGVRRLLKALRHEAPDAAETAERLSVPAGRTVVQVFKALHASHAGRLCLSRVWHGGVAEGVVLGGERVGGLFSLTGASIAKRPPAQAGEVVALGKLEKARAGDILTETGAPERGAFWPEPAAPLFSLSIAAAQRADDVKVSAAVNKLVDEDDSLSFSHGHDGGELVLGGQGPVHLQIALDRLAGRYNVPVTARAPQVPYRETIRKSARRDQRLKRQTGGHGQFADVSIEVRPQERGAGFLFEDRIVGGVIPRNFIPAVEEGVREGLAAGPLGFPVVDLAVALVGGGFHSVDSSEQAFRSCARAAIQSALQDCAAVLLEPIMLVTIQAPSDFTAKVQRLITGRRGQILGFDARAGWPGWDDVKAYMPQADMADLVVELRSLTQGMGTYTASFDHLAELTGRLADRVAEIRASAIAAQ